MYDALQGGTNAEDSDASEVEEEAASDEEDVSSESGASEFEDTADRAKRRTGKQLNSTCLNATHLIWLWQVCVARIARGMVCFVMHCCCKSVPQKNSLSDKCCCNYHLKSMLFGCMHACPNADFHRCVSVHQHQTVAAFRTTSYKLNVDFAQILLPCAGMRL